MRPVLAGSNICVLPQKPVSFQENPCKAESKRGLQGALGVLSRLLNLMKLSPRELVQEPVRVSRTDYFFPPQKSASAPSPPKGTLAKDP